jgi:hypothetical protein
MDDNDIGFMDADLDPEMDHEASLSFEQHMANRTWKSLEAIHINVRLRDICQNVFNQKVSRRAIVKDWRLARREHYNKDLI